MELIRVEVWFENELFRAFPHVRKESIKENKDYMEFMFGNDENSLHRASINMNKVNFVEIMEEK